MAHIRSMEQVTAESTARTNFNMILLSIFAGVALLLAAIGIYGLMAYSVQQRTHEIGIRMALGARANNVLLLVLREGLSLALVGIALGVLGAVWLTQVIKSLLFRVSPNDPLTFTFVGRCCSSSRRRPPISRPAVRPEWIPSWLCDMSSAPLRDRYRRTCL